MKRKFLSILVAVVLACSLGLVTAVPVAAEEEVEYTLEVDGDGTAEWSTDQAHSGSYSVFLSIGSAGGTDRGKITVLVPAIPIADLSSELPSYFQYNVTGEEPDTYLNIFLDTTGDGSVNDYLEGCSATHGTVGAWIEVSEIDGYYYDSSDSLGSGWTTPQDEKTLTDWKTWFATEMPGEVDVVGVKIIYGGVGGEPGAVVYIDDVTINDTTYDLEQPAAVWVATTGDNDNPGTETKPFLTIQYAIDILADGTVNVVAGTYTEDVTIDEELTLSGPNAAISPNTGTRVAKAIIDGTFTFGANNITIQGFDFEFTNPKNGILYAQFSPTYTGLSILKNRFTVVTPDSAGAGANAAILLWIYDAGTYITIDIDDNLFEHIWGIYFEGIEQADISTATITNNVVDGDSTTPPFAGISVKQLTGEISGNTISYTADAGINVGLWCDDLTISNNTVTYANESNTTNAGAINLYSDCTDITITRNTLADSHDGITIKDVGDALGSGIVINYNDISGNSNYGLYMAGLTGTLDAKYNWWGGVAGPRHSTNPYNTEATAALNDVVTANVDYLPWMIHTELVSGWNIYSTPIAAESDPLLPTKTDTIVDALNVWGVYAWGVDDLALYFDPSIGEFGGWQETTSLTPLQGLYIKLGAAATIDVVVSSDATFPPSTVMYTGWNLVGPAELKVKYVNTALLDAYWGTGVAADLQGYSKALSPPLHQSNWTYLRDGTATNKFFVPTEGYWVFMVNQGILGGVTTTPIYYEVP